MAHHGEVRRLGEGEEAGEVPQWTDRFDGYTADNWNSSSNREKAPVIW